MKTYFRLAVTVTLFQLITKSNLFIFWLQGKVCINPKDIQPLVLEILDKYKKLGQKYTDDYFLTYTFDLAITLWQSYLLQ